MTTEPRAFLVEVEQVDRDAAADLVERYYPFEKGMARLARSMRGGHCDTATFTQAFARHRLEALRTQGDGEWVLVPREPTRAICEAIETAMADGRTDHAWLKAVGASPTQASSREEGE